MLQLSSILVPLDGSSFAEQALPLAARLARASSASLRLALVHTPTTAWDPGIEFRLFDPEMELQVRERESGYLEKVARDLSGGNGLHVECALLNGPVAPALEDYITRTGTDLVIMTSHGRGGVERLVMGNVADQLVRRVTAPVIVLRPSDQEVDDSMPRRILVTLDGSLLSESVLDEAAALARILRADILLTMVVQPAPVLLPPFAWPPEALSRSPEERELDARRYLERIKQQLRSQGLGVQSRVRTARKVGREILRIARQEECSMIAMATHGVSGLDRLMLGSIADQVVRHAEVPVLLVRPRDEAPAAEEPLTAALGSMA